MSDSFFFFYVNFIAQLAIERYANYSKLKLIINVSCLIKTDFVKFKLITSKLVTNITEYDLLV